MIGVCLGCEKPDQLYDGLNHYCVDCWNANNDALRESTERALELEDIFDAFDGIADRRGEA